MNSLEQLSVILFLFLFFSFLIPNNSFFSHFRILQRPYNFPYFNWKAYFYNKVLFFCVSGTRLLKIKIRKLLFFSFFSICEN
jgi:hypothetical protein